MKRIREISNIISDNNRMKKYELFIDLFKPTHDAKILDVGASEIEYQKGANILEKKYPYPENITVLGVDNYNDFCKRYPNVKTLTYKGRTFPFKDKEFDICWCNAVIEHVGDKYEQEIFLKEISRVAKQAFITTPNKYFIFESHTNLFLLHYLPKNIFDKILIKLNKPWATGNYMYLLGKKDILNMLTKCNIEEYKLKKIKFMFLTIVYVIVI